MIVQGKQQPQFNRVIQELKNQFADYAVYSFGSNSQQSIIVRKSAFVGVQITIRDRKMMVDACYPNIFISSILSTLTASTIFPFNGWINFERKVSNFLKKEYN